MTFKDIILSDLATFLNVDELADLHVIELEGVSYSIPAVVQDETSDKYEKTWDGVYQSQIEIIFRATDVARPPIRDQQLILDGVTYFVVKSSTEAGMVSVKLAVPEV